MIKKTTIILAAALSILASCKRHTAFTPSDYSEPAYSPVYASGFELLSNPEGNLLLRTLQPWQNGDSTIATQLLILADGAEAPEGFDGQVLRGDAKKIVCMSSSYIAMLEKLGEGQRVAGVSGIDFISSTMVQSRKGEIADVGYDGNIDYEALAACNPDLVLLYGISGASSMEPMLKQLGIPYAYIGEYLEESPLGKAEWLVPVGAIAGKMPQAAEAFSDIPQRYDSLKALAAYAPEKPTVMLNSPYADSWLMASPNSYMARLVADAGGRYVFEGAESNAPTPVDMEQAYLLATQSDVWLNPGSLSTIEQLKAQLPHFASVPAVEKGNVWNCNLRSTAGGGNDFWESGVVCPDLILSDLIGIFHPGLLGDSAKMHYYKPLP